MYRMVIVYKHEEPEEEVLFKDKENYLTTDQINQLPLYNILIVKGFTVRDGNTNLSGFKLVSEILEEYTYPVNVMKIYKELAEKHNLKYQAVERNIRTYKDACGYKDLKNSDYINSLLLTFQLYLEKLGVKNIYE